MKDDWSLLPWQAVREVVRVMTFGLEKHGGVTWPGKPIEHHQAAMMRHISSWLCGEKLDPETGKSHLVHAACRILFIITLETNASTNEPRLGRDPQPGQSLQAFWVRHGE